MLISLSSTVNRKHAAVPLPGFAGGRLRPGTTFFFFACFSFFFFLSFLYRKQKDQACLLQGLEHLRDAGGQLWYPRVVRGPRGSSAGSAAALLDKWSFSVCKAGNLPFS